MDNANEIQDQNKPLLLKAATIETGDLEKSIIIKGVKSEARFGEWRFVTACSNDGFGCCGAYCKDDN